MLHNGTLYHLTLLVHPSDVKVNVSPYS
jgi:hypothetical protein